MLKLNKSYGLQCREGLVDMVGFQREVFNSYADSLVSSIDKMDIPSRFESAICIEAKKG